LVAQTTAARTVTGATLESAAWTRGYAICTAPRSGSNLLGQWLASTSVLGRPLEYFNGPARRELGLPNYPDDVSAQLAAILDIGRTANGVYGVKLFASQFDAIAGTDWTAALPGLRFVHLERRDVVGQAISWARALQTQSYRSTSPARGAAQYDRDLIHTRLIEVIQQQARWRLYFARNGLAPLTVVYEEMLGDPQGVIESVGRLAELPDRPAIDHRRVDLEVQSDAISAEWRVRFLSEVGDLRVL
jgi:trehalose 2-sulfotransferase